MHVPTGLWMAALHCKSRLIIIDQKGLLLMGLCNRQPGHLPRCWISNRAVSAIPFLLSCSWQLALSRAIFACQAGGIMPIRCSQSICTRPAYFMCRWPSRIAGQWQSGGERRLDVCRDRGARDDCRYASPRRRVCHPFRHRHRHECCCLFHGLSNHCAARRRRADRAHLLRNVQARRVTVPTTARSWCCGPISRCCARWSGQRGGGQ